MQKYTWLVIGILFFIPIHIHAAQLLFEIPKATVSVGDSIVVHVRLNTAGESINTADLGILYPAMLRVRSISKSGSFVQLWVKEPSYAQNVIFLSGGVPGGVNGANELVATVTFEAAAIGDGSLGLTPASSVLLNDGTGAAASLTLNTSAIHIIPRKPNQTPNTVPNDVSVKQSQGDVVRPESFDLSIGTDAGLFGGKYFVSFFTTDANSGIDHYEIKEGDKPYTLARSPYLLSDQTLHSVIRVRAYDGAGNYREAVWPGIFTRIWWAILRLFGR